MGNRTVKLFFILGVLTAVVLLLPWPAFSAGFVQPSAEYSADRVMTADGSTITAKVYSASGKERMEIKDSGGMVNIVRTDKKLVWVLMPSEKMYMEHKLTDQKGKRAKGDYQNCNTKQTEKGKEEVNGFSTRKMELEISCPGEDKHTGMIWLTKENIPIRMETSSAGSKKESVRVELKNLKIGKQDSALFEIPAGYKPMMMPSFGDMQNMMK